MNHQLELRLTAAVAAAVGLLSLLGVAAPHTVSAATLTVLALVAFRMAVPGREGADPLRQPAPDRTAREHRLGGGTLIQVTVAQPVVDAGPALVEIRLTPTPYRLLLVDCSAPGMIAVGIHPLGADR